MRMENLCVKSFENVGFDIEIVGIERAKSALKRWRTGKESLEKYCYQTLLILSYGKTPIYL